MPRNKFGGNKAKRGKNLQQPKELILKDDSDQYYAKVTKILGNCRVEVECFNKTEGPKTMLAHIRGKMRKREWVNDGDIVLISLRDYQDNKADVVHKYSSDEVSNLIKLKELESNSLETDIETQECAFDFDEI